MTHRCAAGYQDNNPKKPVILLGSGAEGLSELPSVLQKDNVVYALLRVVGTNKRQKMRYVKFLPCRPMGGVGEGIIGSTQGSKLGKIFSRIPRLEMMFE